ncbi:hypothetical protein NVS89_14740 [Ancylobacter sp. MQZ15Z-1]|uniref:YHYH domain-containing protein n=1 Tax=Ancylobacter mangrovi TaxID=2972472 RepID=A0A9X2T6H0_9HYPH|nr:hypothetical protein [Ancylobacter mangrovi]MCS0496359.1 hypothetical protein [Ancylobacter mangrovi]
MLFRMTTATLAGLAMLTTLAMVGFAPAAEAHGGGCRKNSPPGQCCHMDRQAGTSHCH